MVESTWQPVAVAPFDCDVELAVIDKAGVHVLLVHCRRTAHGWINAKTSKPVDVNPTHWRPVLVA